MALPSDAEVSTPIGGHLELRIPYFPWLALKLKGSFTKLILTPKVFNSLVACALDSTLLSASQNNFQENMFTQGECVCVLDSRGHESTGGVGGALSKKSPLSPNLHP